MMDEFATYICDIFRLFGHITLRPMFAGYGVFRDGLMFGFVNEDTLYLKVDSQNINDFKCLGLAQFQYARQGKLVGLSFYQAPESIMEDPDEAALWARRAFEAALRSNISKMKKGQKRHRG